MTQFKVIPVYNFEGEMEVGRWYDSMLWCPSQCYRHEVVDGVHFILYLRWRWSDPWKGRVVAGAYDEKSMGDAHWSDDLFQLNHIQYSEAEVEMAKEKLVELFNQYWRKT